MRSALSNRVVLMAVIFVVGLSVASALAARSASLLAPPAGPPAVEPAILVGGSDRSLSLQPISVEGQQGINIAGGVTTMTLKAAG